MSTSLFLSTSLVFFGKSRGGGIAACLKTVRKACSCLFSTRKNQVTYNTQIIIIFPQKDSEVLWALKPFFKPCHNNNNYGSSSTILHQFVFVAEKWLVLWLLCFHNNSNGFFLNTWAILFWNNKKGQDGWDYLRILPGKYTLPDSIGWVKWLENMNLIIFLSLWFVIIFVSSYFSLF